MIYGDLYGAMGECSCSTLLKHFEKVGTSGGGPRDATLGLSVSRPGFGDPIKPPLDTVLSNFRMPDEPLVLLFGRTS